MNEGPTTEAQPEGSVDLGRIRVLLCDDHRLLTQALCTVIDFEPDLVMACPPLERGQEAVAACVEHRPDVVLMDIALGGGMDGIEAAGRIKDASPDTQVLIMSGTLPEAAVLVRVAEAGAVGFVDKKGDMTQFMEAIRAAARREMLIDPAALAQLLQEAAREREARRGIDEVLRRLTGREREVLQLLGQGASTDEIANRLYITVPTAKTHIQNILFKLRVHSKLEAVTFATRAGLIRPAGERGAATEESVDGIREL